METFTLTIEMGNAAMNTPQNVADALLRAANKINEYGSWEGVVSDGNGNLVGRYTLAVESDREATGLAPKS